MVDVVVMNHSEDVLEGLRLQIAELGYSTVGMHLRDSTVEQRAAFIDAHEPRVVVYDLGPPPWARALEEWKRLCDRPNSRPYILTTTNPRLDVGEHDCHLEALLPEPLPFDRVAAAVRRALSN